MRKSRFNIIYIMLTIATLLFGYVIFSETEETIKVVGLQNENIENTIVPKPLLYEAKEGTFKFENGISIYVKGKDVDETEEIYNIAGNFAATIKEVSGFEMKVLEGEPNNEKSIFFTTVENNYDLENEGYKINSSEGRIEIIGNKPEGIFRGIQTLKQMLPSEITNKSITPGIE